MKVLVVGLGSMGKRRVRNLQALGIQDIHGFDTREDRRQEAQDRYGITIHATIEEALAQAPDAFIISVPPDRHTEYAMKAVTAGKPFFTEASVVDDGLAELDRLARDAKLVAFPSCTMRFFPGPRRIRELVSGGAIGKVLAWQYQSGQYLPDWHPWEAITDFYVSQRETGGCREIVPFEMVWLVQVFGAVRDLEARKAKRSDLPADIDDIYMLQLRHADGTLGQLIVDVLGRSPVRDLRITGSEGTIEWDGINQQLRVFRVSEEAWAEESWAPGTVEAQYINPEEPYIEEIRSFLACVESGRQPDYTLREDVELLALLRQAERSDELGQRMDAAQQAALA